MPDITGRNRRGQFKPNHSGNLNGRPKDKLSITKMLKDKLDTGAMEIVIDALIEKASDGNLKAIELIFSRVEGRVNLMDKYQDNDSLPRGFDVVTIGMECKTCKEIFQEDEE